MGVEIDGHAGDGSGRAGSHPGAKKGRSELAVWVSRPRVLRSVRTLMPITLVAALMLPALGASADAVDSAVNNSRSSWLPNRSEVEQVANSSASRQAANGAIAHTSLSGLTSICSTAGEIVGAGSSVEVVFDLFLQSAHHRELLLSSLWTAMGTGAVTGADGKIYISVVFCQELNPTTASPPPADPPPPAPSPPPPPPAPSPSSSVLPQVSQVDAPTFTAFNDVFFRLFTGDLSDLWAATAIESPDQPEIGPALFLPMSEWTVPALPTLI